jgi:hypothetical protein
MPDAITIRLENLNAIKPHAKTRNTSTKIIELFRIPASKNNKK